MSGAPKNLPELGYALNLDLTAVVVGGTARADARTKGVGLLAETVPYELVGGNSSAPVSGEMRVGAVGLAQGDVVTNIWIGLISAGSGLTLSRVALYDKSGNRLGQSGDISSSLTSGLSRKALPLTAPVTIPSTDVYQLALLMVGTTPASYMSAPSASLNPGAIGGGIRPWTRQAGLSDTPNPLIPGDVAIAHWFGCN